MYIKPQTVIPPDVKITRLPPSEGKGRSVYSLEREEEARLEKAVENQRREKLYKQAREAGMSVADAAMFADQKK